VWGRVFFREFICDVCWAEFICDVCWAKKNTRCGTRRRSLHRLCDMRPRQPNVNSPLRKFRAFFRGVLGADFLNFGWAGGFFFRIPKTKKKKKLRVAARGADHCTTPCDMRPRQPNVNSPLRKFRAFFRGFLGTDFSNFGWAGGFFFELRHAAPIIDATRCDMRLRQPNVNSPLRKFRASFQGILGADFSKRSITDF
jgi:hypothetical protein